MAADIGKVGYNTISDGEDAVSGVGERAAVGSGECRSRIVDALSD